MSGYRAENIGRIIAEKRKEAGMTQEQLAQKLMITPQAVSKWENGVGLPDVTLIPQIAGALGISMDELFGVSGQARGNVPQTLFGLQLVCVEGDTAVYSNKSIETEQDGTVTFSDGSTADTKTNTVTNCGPGEARILSLHDIAPEALSSDGYERGTLVKTFFDTRSLSVYNGAMCEIEITRGNGCRSRGKQALFVPSGVVCFGRHADRQRAVGVEQQLRAKQPHSDQGGLRLRQQA